MLRQSSPASSPARATIGTNWISVSIDFVAVNLHISTLIVAAQQHGYNATQIK